MALYHGSVSFNGTKDIEGTIALIPFKKSDFTEVRGNGPSKVLISF